LNTLRFYRSRYIEKYGELIICCDSKHYWRRDYFPNYKANRKKDRASSGYDWDFIFTTLNSIRDEIKEHFPYKVLEVYGAEADDIIATLVKSQKVNTVIVSSDKDFIQLHGHKVKQYSPVSKKFVNGTPPQEYLREHIIRGDRSDGVPNVLSPDDTFTESKRQKPIRKTMLITLTEAMEKWEPKDLFQLAKCNRDTWVRNWQRNETLIDLGKIPHDIRDKILREFKNASTGDRSKLFNYFVEKKLNNLIQSIGDF
jgi:5'-3' exonuclease